jgi:hypothetical protein
MDHTENTCHSHASVRQLNFSIKHHVWPKRRIHAFLHMRGSKIYLPVRDMRVLHILPQCSQSSLFTARRHYTNGTVKGASFGSNEHRTKKRTEGGDGIDISKRHKNWAKSERRLPYLATRANGCCNRSIRSRTRTGCTSFGKNHRPFELCTGVHPPTPGIATFSFTRSTVLLGLEAIISATFVASIFLACNKSPSYCFFLIRNPYPQFSSLSNEGRQSHCAHTKEYVLGGWKVLRIFKSSC